MSVLNTLFTSDPLKIMLLPSCALSILLPVFLRRGIFLVLIRSRKYFFHSIEKLFNEYGFDEEFIYYFKPSELYPTCIGLIVLAIGGFTIFGVSNIATSSSILTLYKMKLAFVYPVLLLALTLNIGFFLRNIAKHAEFGVSYLLKIELEAYEKTERPSKPKRYDCFMSSLSRICKPFLFILLGFLIFDSCFFLLETPENGQLATLLSLMTSTVILLFAFLVSRNAAFNELCKYDKVVKGQSSRNPHELHDLMLKLKRLYQIEKENSEDSHKERTLSFS